MLFALITIILPLFFSVVSESDEHTINRKKSTYQKNNQVHILVVFSKFNGEAAWYSQPPEWSERLFDGNQGSVNHYYDEISFDQITVTGEYLPKLYELPRESSYYVRKYEE